MPEAPEVQTVLSTLEGQIKNVKIIKVDIRYPKLIGNMDSKKFEEKLKGQSIQSFYRIGKYLGFETESYDWICHLRMEGKFYLLDTVPSFEEKHIHAVMELENHLYLCYHDVRKFGRMVLYEKRKDKGSFPCFCHVGKDFLDVDGFYVFSKFSRMKKAVKTALLDQSVIAGIGNIYADEILFACKIHPETKANLLTLEDCEKIVYHTKRILKEAIHYGGTTIRSYTSSLGVTGQYQNYLQVHRREGQKCPICHSEIIKIKVGQRSSYLCPECQKRK